MASEPTKKDLDEYEAHLGIDSTKLQAYCGKLRWPINPKGHTSDVVKAMDKFIDEYETFMDKKPNALEKERYPKFEACSKGILDVALVGFNYKEAANDADAGPALLHALAIDVRTFLAVTGGRVGQKRLQIQLNLIKAARSLSTKASTES